jgi:hypothetical protein
VSSNISAYGPIDSYIQGTFTGPVSNGGAPVTVTGSFKIQRTN